MDIKVRPGGEGEYSPVVQSDCRYYTGYKPCGKNENCTGCNKCVEICPGDILREGDGKPEVAYPEECWHCAHA